ncbi:MAG: hypothetical protein ACRDGA_09120 [Bacteroidota bacterium]
MIERHKSMIRIPIKQAEEIGCYVCHNEPHRTWHTKNGIDERTGADKTLDTASGVQLPPMKPILAVPKSPLLMCGRSDRWGKSMSSADCEGNCGILITSRFPKLAHGRKVRSMNVNVGRQLQETSEPKNRQYDARYDDMYGRSRPFLN